jgi:hypothetical protein
LSLIAAPLAQLHRQALEDCLGLVDKTGFDALFSPHSQRLEMGGQIGSPVRLDQQLPIPLREALELIGVALRFQRRFADVPQEGFNSSILQ